MGLPGKGCPYRKAKEYHPVCNPARILSHLDPPALVRRLLQKVEEAVAGNGGVEIGLRVRTVADGVAD